jgi:hypothetical protein
MIARVLSSFVTYRSACVLNFLNYRHPLNYRGAITRWCLNAAWVAAGLGAPTVVLQCSAVAWVMKNAVGKANFRWSVLDSRTQRLATVSTMAARAWWPAVRLWEGWPYIITT